MDGLAKLVLVDDFKLIARLDDSELPRLGGEIEVAIGDEEIEESDRSSRSVAITYQSSLADRSNIFRIWLSSRMAPSKMASTINTGTIYNILSMAFLLWQWRHKVCAYPCQYKRPKMPVTR